MAKKSKSRKEYPPFLSKRVVLFVALLLLIIAGFVEQQGYADIDELLRQLEEIAGTGDESSPPAAPAESMGDIQPFFTTPYLVYPDVPEQREPPPSEQALLADIAAAQRSVDIAAFEYNLESVADALLQAQSRGVAVRLALDHENLEKPEMAAWAGRLEEAGIPIAWEDSTAFLHSKFAIIDDAIVWMGSWNFTNNGTYRNNNNLVRFTVPAVVENYAVEFSQMSEGLFGNDKEPLTPNPLVDTGTAHIETYFSPQDGVADHVVERLNEAQHSIRFLAFSYTSDPIAEAMIARHEDGVQVQGVFETRNASGIGAEFDRLHQAGIEVYEDGNCYTMHHKLIIIDDQTVVTGSYNFTARAEETNDENLVIIDQPEIAQEYLQEFERVYEQARFPPRCGVVVSW